MLDCWHEDPNRRPSFSSLRESLEIMIEDVSSAHYVTICVDESSPCYHQTLESEDTLEGEDTRHTMEVEDEVFELSSCSSSILDLGTEQGSRGVAPRRGKRTSGSSSILPDLQDRTSPESLPGSDQLFFPSGIQLGRANRRQHLRPPGPGCRLIGKREDLLRVSTCSQDQLLPCSQGESIASDLVSIHLTFL